MGLCSIIEGGNLHKGPLEGFKVLDMSSVVSGPMAAVMLADQGADVVKIEPPGWGDGIRRLGANRNGLSAIYAMINRNKRSLALNFKHPRGKDLLVRLVEQSDVLLQNYRPRKLDRIGLGYEDLKVVNENLIYTSISGMGSVGPYASQRVYDYVIQGLSGVLDAQADGGDMKMVRTIIYDKVTALLAAQAITAALLARERGQGGQHVELSMLDGAVYFNWPDLMWNYSFKGQGVQYAGDLADIYEISKTSDGAIVSNYLGADTSGYETDQLVDLLVANEIPVARANRREDVLTDPQVEASEMLREFEHPRGGPMLLPRNAAKFSNSPELPQQPSAELGQHTYEILKTVGLELSEMKELSRLGVIG